MLLQQAYTAARIFTGHAWLHDHAVICREGRIESVVPLTELDPAIPLRNFGDAILCPAFIDLQIYGAGGKLLASFPETETLSLLADHNARGGTALCLPTVATNEKTIMFACIDAVKDYIGQGGKGIGGIHLEGPWIHPDKRGAHIASLIHPPTAEEVKEWVDYGRGTIRMITLAPEVCSDAVIEYLLAHDIILSAGHSNASLEQSIHGFDLGIKAVTHLFNAMSPFQHRAPGLAAAAMDDARVMASIIPDGHHVDFAAVRIAKKAMGERLFAITDAVTETEGGYYPHRLAGDKYESEGILSGSALSMNQAVKNLVTKAGIALDEALRMASLYPAKVLRMDRERGRIDIGFRSEIAVMNGSFDILELINE